ATAVLSAVVHARSPGIAGARPVAAVAAEPSLGVRGRHSVFWPLLTLSGRECRPRCRVTPARLRRQGLCKAAGWVRLLGYGRSYPLVGARMQVQARPR